MVSIHKSINVLLLLLTLPFVHAYGQTAEAAIREVLQAELSFATKHSVAEVVQQFWIIDDKTLLHRSTTDGNVQSFDKAALLAMTEAPQYPKAVSTIANQKVYVNGNNSIVSQDKGTILEDGKKITALEVKYLQLKDGAWKIHAASVQEF
jgi:lipopolysaccharide assembly outer membrane protein LptD (OstA)